jgi:hypothetical protein
MKRTFSLVSVILLALFVSYSPSEANLSGTWNVLAKVHVSTTPAGDCTYEGSASIVQDTPSHLSGPVSVELTACEVVPGELCFCPPRIYQDPSIPPPPQPLPPFTTDCTISGSTLNCSMCMTLTIGPLEREICFPSQATLTSPNSAEGAFDFKLPNPPDPDETEFAGSWTATLAAPPVPAFDRWGILLFALLLVASAFWFVRRKKAS